MFSTMAACCLWCFLTLTSDVRLHINEEHKGWKRQKQTVEHLFVLCSIPLSAAVFTMAPSPSVNGLNSLCLSVINLIIDSVLFWFWLVLHRVKVGLCHVNVFCMSGDFIGLHSYSWFNNYLKYIYTYIYCSYH